MQRPSATAVLLAAAAFARAAAIGLGEADSGIDPRSAVLVVDVLVPIGIAAADIRGRPTAPTAAVAYGALGAGTLMASGLTALQGTLAVTPALLAFLAAVTLAMLAAATAIGRWQDHGAPPAGPGPRWLRITAIAAAASLAVLLVTAEVAVMGTIDFDVGTLPGPVAIATTVSLPRLPLLAVTLLTAAWAATRTGTGHLLAVSLVLGARALVEAVADASLLPLGATVWPTVLAAVTALVLLVVVPIGAQVTSSRA